MKKHIFIIGSKGIPAQYGGFETFVEGLVGRKQSTELQYHVACMGLEEKEFNYKNARCFQIKVPDIGPGKAIYYDIMALRNALSYIREKEIHHAVIYILACRVGPFIGFYKKKMEKMGIKLYVNPDGHEWLRGKWSFPVKRYWKFSEKLMVKHADFLVCDSKNMEVYIHTEYGKYKPQTTYIAYGAEVSKKEDEGEKQKAERWFREKGLLPKEYYLIVGRFVPENNYETMIREFMSSNTHKKLVLVTNVENNRFYRKLAETTGFEKDSRICFAGTVYDAPLLCQIRKNAYAYIHGHEVGGTNPSLLEALGTTKVNLLLGVGFNREVGEHGAIYWDKETGNLKGIIEETEKMDESSREALGNAAKSRIQKAYSWENIVSAYEELFLEEKEA